MGEVLPPRGLSGDDAMNTDDAGEDHETGSSTAAQHSPDLHGKELILMR